MIKGSCKALLGSYVFLACTMFSAVVHAEQVPTLAEAQSAFLSNVSQIQTGLITFQIEDVRSKENLLGALGHSPQVSVVPIVEGQVDVALSGEGEFQWKGTQFISKERRGHISSDGVRVVAGIVHRVEAFDGNVARNLIRSYSVDTDPTNTANLGLVDGQLASSRGTIGSNKPSVGGCPLFRSLAYFCPGLLETENYLVDSFGSESLVMEGSRVVLTKNGSDLKVVLDPEKSFMPVEVRSGQDGVDGFLQRVSYVLFDGVWFPETEITQRWAEGKLVYTTTCTLDTHDFNADYPNEDFDISYPAGTEVEDTLQDIEYVAEAN